MSEAKGISRRSFFKLGTKAAVAGVAGVAASAFISNEIKAIKEGITTPAGDTVTINYEKHGQGVDETDIPDQAFDLFFREGIFSKDDTASFSAIVRGKTNSKRLFSQGVIKKLVQNAPEGIRFIGGDILLTGGQKGIHELTQTLKFGLGGALASISLLPNSPTTEEQRRELKKQGFTRRFIMSRGLALIGGALMLPRLRAIIANTLDPKVSKSSREPLGRVLQRMSGIASNFQPEDALYFFRNLMFAYKIQVAGDQLRQELGRPLKIGGILGHEHSGIEDLLRLDKQILMRMILAFPSSLLDMFAAQNDGLNNLSGYKMFQVNKESRAELDEDTLIRKIDESGQWTKKYDQPLTEALKARIHGPEHVAKRQ